MAIQVFAVVESDQFMLAGFGFLKEAHHRLFHRRGRQRQLAVQQRDHLSRLHVHAVNLHRARGDGDLARLHGGQGLGHLPGNGIHLPVRVVREHGGQSLRHGLARHHGHLFHRHLFGLVRGQDDVPVVRQDDDLVGRQVLERGQNLLRGWVHRLPALNDGARAERGEDAAQSLARRDDHHRDLSRLHNLKLDLLGLRFLDVIHLRQQVFHRHFGDGAESHDVVNRFVALVERHVDVHAVHALALAHLDGGAHPFEFAVERLQVESAVREEVHHHFVILALFDRLHRVLQIHGRHRLDVHGRDIQRLAVEVA